MSRLADTATEPPLATSSVTATASVLLASESVFAMLLTIKAFGVLASEMETIIKARRAAAPTEPPVISNFLFFSMENPSVDPNVKKV